jgi:hypothetical protein
LPSGDGKPRLPEMICGDREHGARETTAAEMRRHQTTAASTRGWRKVVNRFKHEALLR